mgnify:CR=1 FL=1
MDRRVTRMRDVFASSSVKEDLGEMGATMTADDLLTFMVADEKSLQTFAGAFPPLTADHPRTQYFLLRHFFHSYPPMSKDLLRQRLNATQ